MTYIGHLDPNNRATLDSIIIEEMWDEAFPDWRELSLDPEVRRFVSENDITE